MFKINSKIYNSFSKLNFLNRLQKQTSFFSAFYSDLSYSFISTTKLTLKSDTVGSRLISLAREKPNDVCFKFCLTKSSFTYKDIKQRVDEFAQNLLNLGFKKGDRLAIMLPNIPEINISILAAASIGVVSVLMNPAYQLVEIEYMLKKTNAKGLIMLDNLKTLQHYTILNKICPELQGSSKGELNSKNLPNLKHVILVKNRLVNDSNIKYKGTWSFDELEHYNSISKEIPHVEFDDTLAMLFTVFYLNIFKIYKFLI